MRPEQFALRIGRLAILGVAGLSLMCAHSAGPSVDPPSSPTFLTSLSPASGAVGTQITARGGGFTPTGNSIKFGAGYINNLESSDGVTLRFTVPDGLNLCPPPPMGEMSTTPCPSAYPQVKPGSYSISVMNEKGSSGDLAFVVTAR
jgi:hypothetical protein